MRNIDEIDKLASKFLLLALADEHNIKVTNPNLYYRMKDFANRVSANQVDIHIDPSDSRRIIETKIKDEATSAEFYKQFAKELAVEFMNESQEVWQTVLF